ncbi:MAG: hypothetical protein IPJ98_08350 [Bryobacterales bacterium]|nr:hypothetical protein [Bryobacterales bacterium]
MRWMLVWLLAAGQMTAQAPVRLVRGEVVGYAYAEGTGEIAVRDALYRVHKCGLTAGTWVEMNNKRLTLGDVRLTMTAEVVADTRAGAGQCTALTIYLREAMPRWPAVRPLSAGSSILDNLWPRGNLVFTGTVRALGDGELVVRTRKGEEQRMRVREDTVFSTGGRVVKPVALELQQRVQVRAGKGYDGRMEVYQVTWGEILQPESERQSGGSGPNR